MANVSHLLLTRINHESKMVRKIANLFENEALTDVTLSCEGQMINAHKLILSTSSSYFQSIFQNSLIRNQINPVIIIKDMKLVDLRNIIEFIYSGEVYVSEDQLESLVKSAESLNVSGLSRVDPSRRSHLHCNRDLSINDTMPEQALDKLINSIQNENKLNQEKSNSKRKASLKKVGKKKIKESSEELNDQNLPKSKFKHLDQKINSVKQLSPPRYNFRIKSKDSCNKNCNYIVKNKNEMKPLSDNQTSSEFNDILSKNSKKKIKTAEINKISTSSQVSSTSDKTLKCNNDRYQAMNVASTSLSSKVKKTSNFNKPIEFKSLTQPLKSKIYDRMTLNFSNKMDTLLTKEQSGHNKKVTQRRASIKSLKEEEKVSNLNGHGSVIKKSSNTTTRSSINYPIIRKTRGVKTTDMLKKEHGARLAAKKLKASKASLNAKKANWALAKHEQDSKATFGTESTPISTLEKIIAKAKRKRGRPKKIVAFTVKAKDGIKLKQKKREEIKLRLDTKEGKVSERLAKGVRMKWMNRNVASNLRMESYAKTNDLE